MSDVTTKVFLSASKSGGASFDGKLDTGGINMSGSEMVAGATQLIATGSWQAVSFGAITGAPGMWKVKNLSASNYVQFALANDGTKIFGRLQAGQINLLSLESGTIYAQAHTAGVRIQSWATEA